MVENRYEIFITTDGSHSVKLKNSAITFHSTHGALQESQHIFINAGLQFFMEKYPEKRKIKIFEVGFGSGLNALLSAICASKYSTDIAYHTIDLHPLQSHIYSKLNYAIILQQQVLYNNIMKARWDTIVPITPLFTINKIHKDLLHLQLNKEFDIVYFDAFASDDQPELWTNAVFTAMYHALNHNGILVTYCSKSLVQKSLKQAGFIIEKLPGPRGKREILRATKHVY